MPISLKQLRQDPHRQQALRSSLELRQRRRRHGDEEERPPDDNHTVVDVNQLLDNHATYTRLLHQVEVGRSQRKQEQQRQRRKLSTSPSKQPQQEEQDPSLCTISAPKLQQLEQSLEELHSTIQDQLHRLTNYVDTELEHHLLLRQTTDNEKETHQNSRATTTTTKLNVHQSLLQENPQEDVLFAIGGYERLCLGRNDIVSNNQTKNNNNKPTLWVWTDTGVELQTALQHAWKEWLHAQRQKDVASSENHLHESFLRSVHSWNFPVSSVAARQGSDSSLCGSHWETVLQSLEGTTLYDRVLPQCHFLYSASCRMSQCFPCSTSPAMPPKHTAKQKKQQQQQPHEWLECLESPHVEGLFLTGPSLSADSRPLQVQWMEWLQSFYTNLIVTSTTQDMDPSSQCMQVIAVPPSQLEAFEASRLVLVGTLPHSKQTIELAYLSNLLDYCSLDIRHGNSPQASVQQTTAKNHNGDDKVPIHRNHKVVTKTAASVHVVRGVLCRSANAMAWMLAWNYHHDPNQNTAHVVLPQSIQQHLFRTPPKIPIVRRKRVNGKGKTIVEHVSVTKSPNPTTKGAQPRVDKLVVPNQRLTKDQIRAEALSCPFFFLPFYYT